MPMMPAGNQQQPRPIPGEEGPQHGLVFTVQRRPVAVGDLAIGRTGSVRFQADSSIRSNGWVRAGAINATRKRLLSVTAAVIGIALRGCTGRRGPPAPPHR